MARTSNILIPKFRFSEPVRNLPNHPTGCGGEDRLALRFAQAYAASLAESGDGTRTHTALARQIPVTGYGIADIVAVTWDRPSRAGPPVTLSSVAFSSPAKPVICAFEVKLRDWRKALMQASRYRFFAHVAAVVMPEDACGAALKFLDTFHLLKVGLWTFDAKSRRITTHFTPLPAPPRDMRRAMNAMSRVARITRALPIS